MELDISVYKNVIPSDDETECFTIYNIPEFRARCTAFPEGDYEAEEIFSFRAGSYSTYNELRRQIAGLINTTPEKVWKNPDYYSQKPFYELINFADNEGTIDFIVSEKLAKDFQQSLPLAEERIIKSHYLETYKCFLTAFTLAAKNKGIVRFL